MLSLSKHEGFAVAPLHSTPLELNNCPGTERTNVMLLWCGHRYGASSNDDRRIRAAESLELE